MKQVTLYGSPTGTLDQKIAWLTAAVQKLAEASRQNDPVIIFQNYTVTNPTTELRTLDATSATLANIRAILQAIIDDFQKGGVNRAN